MKIIKNLEFDNIKNIDYAFFTREGGHSNGIFESLNTNFSGKTGESIESVELNLQVIKKHFNTDYDIIKIKQTHSNKVFIFDDLNILPSLGEIEADSIITKLKNVVIGVSTADCVPILLVDEESEVIAVIHSGWKGSLIGITENTIKKMKELDAKANKIKALIGPHLRVENFEIKQDFVDNLKNINQEALKFVVQKNNKMFFDISSFVKNLLRKENISKIYDVNLDTYSNSKLFFSYRKNFQKNEMKYGTQFSGIMLK